MKQNNIENEEWQWRNKLQQTLNWMKEVDRNPEKKIIHHPLWP